MKNGGPAFPEVRTEYDIRVDEREVTSVGGMSLRDYFAAASMQAIAPQLAAELGMIDFAKLCYEAADAMLKAREEP